LISAWSRAIFVASFISYILLVEVIIGFSKTPKHKLKAYTYPPYCRDSQSFKIICGPAGYYNAGLCAEFDRETD